MTGFTASNDLGPCMCSCGTTAGWVLPSTANRCDGGVPKCGSTGAACTDATKPTCVEPTSFATPTYISETATCQVTSLICNSTSNLYTHMRCIGFIQTFLIVIV